MTGNTKNGACAADPLDTLAAWRAQGAHRLNPIRFHFIEALSRRAADQHGYARRALDEKLATLLEAYRQGVLAAEIANGVEPAAGLPEPGTSAGKARMDNVPAGAAAARTASTGDGPGPLTELLSDLAARQPAPSQDADKAAVPPGLSVYPELPLLDYFRDTWSRYSTRRQLKQSQERVPENAGPLNSSLLVHRALSLMGEVSPEYLHQFLSYVDALSWMEQATRVDLLVDKDGTRTLAARKTPRGASR